jgi:hypothetical protein
MAQPVKKERVALNTTELGRFMKETPKAVTENDKYGKTVWCDKTTWDDGSQSLSGYNSETKSRYNLGKVFPPREQDGQATSQPAPAQVQTQDDGLPF